ncbi:MAG: hypothetical protein Q8L81_00880 [Bacteroidota bacterium]|nr:hypothetical protein [Bacteroidota bacterium]
MKKINVMLILAATMFTTSLLSQNTFPTGVGTSVGIGTLTPYTRLHVADGVVTVSGNNPYGGPQIVLGPAPSNNNIWGIETMPTGLNFWRPGIGGQVNQGNYFLFLKHTNGNVGIKTNNPTAGLTVNSNVLIGNPATVNLPAGYKLYVETGILTEKVKVAVKNTANWADYVFDKNYKMLSLSEVEAYVNKNKHLPGVPSADEVVENGIDMAAMDAKLLEKIEELTLYVIKLEKEMNELKRKH